MITRLLMTAILVVYMIVMVILYPFLFWWKDFPDIKWVWREWWKWIWIGD